MTALPNFVSVHGNRFGLTPYGLRADGLDIFPNGVPFAKGAQRFFVDPANGDDGASGKDPNHPLDTVSAAYALTTDKRGDVIFLLNDGNTSGTSREDETITWAKDNTHLIGVCAPTMVSQRARISPTTTLGSIVTPQLKVTGHGNIFKNISFFEGDDENSVASVGIEIELGNRNYFENVAIMNMGDAANGNSGDEANSAHLLIDGGQENMFVGCYIGLDTAPRSAANANVRFTSNGGTAAARNIFVDCVFPMLADASTPLFVQAAAAGSIDRWNLFKRCMFINALGSTGTALDAAVATHASAGGLLIFQDSYQYGGGEWVAANNSNVVIATPTAVSPGGGQALPFTT